MIRARAPLTPGQGLLAAALLAGGAGLRAWWCFAVHPAGQHVYSDMAGYVDRANRWAAGLPESVADTVYPPGTSLLFGLLYRLDPGRPLSAIALWLLSVGGLALIGLIARRLYGTAAALVALAIAAPYPPFAHYAALFLSETPFAFALLLAVWLTLRAAAARHPAARCGWALGAGLALGLAAAFKNTVLLPFLLTAAFFLPRALRSRQRWPALALGLAGGIALSFVPMAERCTRLSEGHFCLSANNIALNVLMGHDGRNGPYHWHDAARGIDFEFTSPSASQRGYTNRVSLDFGAYDNPANLSTALSWCRSHPGQALRQSLDNIVDLIFTPGLWPRFEWAGIDLGHASQWYFWLLILPPALLHLASRRPGPAEALLALPLLGLVATVFLSIGETRHRVPFDGLAIVLAAAGWVRAVTALRQALRRPGPPPTPA